MNYLHDCRTCGGPVYGTWLASFHTCRPTPLTATFQVPDMSAYTIQGPAHKPTGPTAEHDRITPGEATRLCALIKIEISKHFALCKWCQMLKEQDLMCVDGLLTRDTLEKWEQYTLIEVDRA
jgi:hypothetical protein